MQRDRQKHSLVVSAAMVRVSVIVLAAVLKECFLCRICEESLPLLSFEQLQDMENDKRKMRGQGER